MAAQNRALLRLARILVFALLMATPILVTAYLIDQHTDRGSSLAERTIAATEAQVRQNPDNLGLRLKLAAAYLASDRADDALKQYDEVLAVAPANVPALLGKAGILQAGPDKPAAALLYGKVIDIRKGGEMAAADPDLERAYYGLGTSSNALGQYGAAIVALEAAVRIDGTDADSWYALGLAQLNGGSMEQAIAAERNAIVFVPLEWADPYKVMEQAYAKLGKTANAAWAHAMVDMVAKRYAEAKAQLAPLVDGPAAADATLAMGFVAEAQGDKAAALDWYKKALKLDPSSEGAASGVARLGETPAITADPVPPAAPSHIPASS